MSTWGHSQHFGKQGNLPWLALTLTFSWLQARRSPAPLKGLADFSPSATSRQLGQITFCGPLGMPTTGSAGL